MDYDDYKSNFAYLGESIYTHLFELHSEKIKTKKKNFAVNNLEKIFKATFKISTKIGFHEMSLRDLCRETGLSMGGIYSCIASKEIIAIMIKDMVKHISAEILQQALEQKNNKQAITTLITSFIYTTEILQPWFYFLYFETRSLPTQEQETSKEIETSIIEALETMLRSATKNKKTGKPKQDYHFTATTLLAVIQERYLKPWKYKNSNLSIEEYKDQTLKLAYAAIT